MVSKSSNHGEWSVRKQRDCWFSQAESIPELRGGRESLLPLTLELLKQVSLGKANDKTQTPEIADSVLKHGEERTSGARPNLTPSSWASYLRFLRSLNLVHEVDGSANLTKTGQGVLEGNSQEVLARQFSDNFRLFAEILEIIRVNEPTTGDLANYIEDSFGISWKTQANIRKRIDWMRVLGLIERNPGNKWGISSRGKDFLDGQLLITPEAVRLSGEALTLREPPEIIASMLKKLGASSDLQLSRNTYNIWVPSPASRPNKVTNLRTIIEGTMSPVNKEEFLTGVCDVFGLRRSSVDSMMPFLRAAGLIEEIRLGIYAATPAARAWISSDDDLNFIRILHFHMRFVGELIKTVGDGLSRAELYAVAKNHGMNVEKTRWIISFLECTGLVEPPRYGYLRATPTGISLIEELPLAEEKSEEKESPIISEDSTSSLSEKIEQTLIDYSRSPRAGGENSGYAFELAVADAFRELGFQVTSVGGSGNPDLILRWRDETDAKIVAVVEVKSRSSGKVAHTDISDVALEAHKRRSSAQFVAIVGPSFSGETIIQAAALKQWVLIDAEYLASLVRAQKLYGLGVREFATLFGESSGRENLDQIIESKSRNIRIIEYIISSLQDEYIQTGEPLTPRDMQRDGRRSELKPGAEEVNIAIESLVNVELDVIRTNKMDGVQGYSLGDIRSGIAKLRMLANALERSIKN